MKDLMELIKPIDDEAKAASLVVVYYEGLGNERPSNTFGSGIASSPFTLARFIEGEWVSVEALWTSEDGNSRRWVVEPTHYVSLG